MTLQQLVVQIQGLSANDSDLNGLNDMLKSSATEALLKQHNTAILDALRSLNFESHSLGCLYLL